MWLYIKELGWDVRMADRRACGERPSAVAAGRRRPEENGADGFGEEEGRD